MVTLSDIMPTSRLAQSAAVGCAGLFAQQPPLDLDRWTRLTVALVAIVVVGFVLIASVFAWGRRMRRGLRRPPKSSRMARDAWYEKPLVRDVDEPSEDELD